MSDPKVKLDMWKQRVAGESSASNTTTSSARAEKSDIERRVEVLENDSVTVRKQIWGNAVQDGMAKHLGELEEKYDSLKREHEILKLRFDKLLGMMEVEVDMDAK